MFPGNKTMFLIERNYLQKLIDVIGTPDIKVITGVRRSGKSKLLDAFFDYINKLENKVIRIKLTEKKFSNLLDSEYLYRYVDEHYVENKTNYLLIDEIQLCNGFETIINSLHDEERFDIYLTGSNAFLLSSDLSTLFGGRTFELNVLPFSFEEYCRYYQLNNEAFDQYFVEGGMAGSYLYKNRMDKIKYINSVYKTTIVKDIVKKYKIENEPLLIMIANYLMDTVGNITSIRNIANRLSSNKLVTNDKTVGLYISYLCKSFLFYPIERFDVRGGKYLATDKKYYLSDLSFRFANLGTKDVDYGFLYENLVALELLRREYEIYVGVLYDKEIDFVAIKEGKRIYIQVADDISNENTLQREVKPLLSIRDAYPKMIIARTKHPEANIQGIRVIDIAEWLINVE